MPKLNGPNGTVKTIIAVIGLAGLVAGWAWGIGKGAVEDTVMENTESIRANTDSIREIERDCATFEKEFEHIKEQLQKQDKKLDKILDKL